ADELPRQVLSDGVDFESSTAYHRLVLELFLLPALYREAQGFATPEHYRERLIEMARFTRAYTRPTGDAPLWGDADDARVLPLSNQPLNDHRYLLGLVGSAWNVADLQDAFSGPQDEVFWLLGPEACAHFPQRDRSPACSSQSFSEAGVYVLRNERD